MQRLGITSEAKLRQMVNLAERRIDAKVVVAEEIQVLTRRAQEVSDIVAIVRAVVGDGGVGFGYVAFQVHGNTVILIRCKMSDWQQIKAQVASLQVSGIEIGRWVAERLGSSSC